MARFFVKPTEISSKIVNFNEDKSKKIRKVLRMRLGDTLEVFDGSGWSYEVKLLKITNEHSSGEIINKKLFELETNVILIQALPKQLKMEFILQKCTELGVDKIVFFSSDHSQIEAEKINKEKVRRWRSISEQACEQAGRIFVPQVELFAGTLEQILTTIKNDEIELFYLNINGENVNSIQIKNKNLIAFFVGPEGGFSKKEESIFEKE